MDRLEELANYDIHSIEQPIRQGQWDEMARLCKESPLAIALDEEMIGVNNPKEKARLLDAIHPQYIVLKPTMHGGISGTHEWIELANKRGINSWITSALESNIGLRSIALLAESVYGPNITFPQGLGTGQLFTDNIENNIHIEGAFRLIKNRLRADTLAFVHPYS
jgi:L-alanine-DL-glutamate epimerase-like enolase superfamily enzyme